MSKYPTRLSERDNVLVVQPHKCDAGAYWASVDMNPMALVHVNMLDDDGDHWHSSVFSTREKAEAYVLRRPGASATIHTLIIDDPDYGNVDDDA